MACYTTPPKSTWSPTARLLFVNDEDGFQYVCTGSLVSVSNANTLITNNHCIDTQSETSTLQARFNYQKKNCSGNQLETQSNYSGGSFLKTSAIVGGLDYTLVTLLGNPAATWGTLTPTTLGPVDSSLMHFPQHPGSGSKTLGRFEDRQQDTRWSSPCTRRSAPARLAIPRWPTASSTMAATARGDLPDHPS